MKKLKSSEYVKKWRHNFRRRIVEAFGGECGICGYSRCQEALELHHLDPQVKELSFNRIIARACNWVKVVAELRKCVLLCSICHREYHFGVVEIPSDIKRFDENFADYKVLQMESCPVCGELKKKGTITCSRSCAIKKSYKIDWPENLPALIAGSSMVSLAQKLGVSDKAIAKRLRTHHQTCDAPS